MRVARAPARAAPRPRRARRAGAQSRYSGPAHAARARARVTGSPGSRGSSRTVASRSSGASSGSCARCSSRCSDAEPAHCRSSSTTSSGRRRAARSSARLTASNSRKRLCSGARASAPGGSAQAQQLRRARPRGWRSRAPHRLPRLLEQAPQHLREQPERGNALAVARAPDQRERTGGFELGRRDLGEPRLADARRAGDQHHRALAAAHRSRKCLAQLRQRVGSPDERALASARRSGRPAPPRGRPPRR